MLEEEAIKAECAVFVRYLSGQLPDSYIVDKYSVAFSPGQPLSEVPQSGFDAFLLRLAITHPLITRAIDAFSRFFYKNSSVSKRLIVLLAILESRAATAASLDSPDKGAITGFILSMVMQLTIFAILLGIATILLLPLKLLFGRQPVKS